MAAPLTQTIARALARAVRRGRISPVCAHRIHGSWVAQRNQRSKAHIWSLVAAAALGEAMASRRNRDRLRHLLAVARDANQRARKA